MKEESGKIVTNKALRKKVNKKTGNKRQGANKTEIKKKEVTKAEIKAEISKTDNLQSVNNGTEETEISRYINRELSWLEFNMRVLEEAYDHANPLFERLKFASIVSSNLDEFYMVRVASIHDQVLAGFSKTDFSGLLPQAQLDKIYQKVQEMVGDQYSCFSRSIMPALKKNNVYFLKEKELTVEQQFFIKEYYHNAIHPVLTPMVVDKSRPFPLILSKTLNIALLLENKDRPGEIVFATVQVPSVLPRFIEIPKKEGAQCFILLERIIAMNLEDLFDGHDIVSSGYYRVTRNAEHGLDEEGAEDLLEAIEQFVKMRKWGSAIRLEIEYDMEEGLLEMLVEEFEVPRASIFRIHGPLDLTFLLKFYSLIGYDHLRYPHHLPKNHYIDKDIFEEISQGEILLHHPYESFDPVADMVQKAAVDPGVLAIKQTLYRVSGHSPIVQALMQAAENGKQVTVLVELKARFDEENNIIWAKRLEIAGCHVIYGVLGLKTHCKMLMIVRREEEGLKRYIHLGTGNYNDVTAKFYTDMGLMTCNPYIGSDVAYIFNMLSGYSQLNKLYKTSVAPYSMREKFINMIKKEAKNALSGKEARIIAKFNSLVDERIIDALYEASSCGVEIDLIVRGICCLRPKVKGLSDRITVRSIVGRYLEHSRIYYFYNDGEEQYFLSSADLMGRNLDWRVEILFPVEDPKLMEKLRTTMEIYLHDSEKTRIMKGDGTYVRVDRRGKEHIHCQEYFIKHNL